MNSLTAIRLLVVTAMRSCMRPRNPGGALRLILRRFRFSHTTKSPVDHTFRARWQQLSIRPIDSANLQKCEVTGNVGYSTHH